jgi:hypothetical protein
MIGAGTLSTRLRSSPASYNHIAIGRQGITVTARNRTHQPTAAVQVAEVPTGPLPGEADGVLPL